MGCKGVKSLLEGGGVSRLIGREVRLMARLKLPIDIKGEEVELVVDATIVNNGIGSYEFWGAKGTQHSYEAEWEIISTNPHIDPFIIWDDEELEESITRKVERLLDRISEEEEIDTDRWEEKIG